eukprot:768143-Rhodomonas_salina.2
MGLPPGVVSATAAYMLLWTTASTTIQFGIMGEMLWDYAIALWLVGLASAIFGQLVLPFVLAARAWYLCVVLRAFLYQHSGTASVFGLSSFVVGCCTVSFPLRTAARVLRAARY